MKKILLICNLFIISFLANATCAYQGYVFHTQNSGNSATFQANTYPANQGYTYSWIVPAGVSFSSTSTQNPTATFYNNGSYTICCVVTDSNNCSTTFCDSIYITQASNCTASFTTSNTTNTTFAFAGLFTTTSATTNYHWNFGDGTTATGQNPTHTYTANGTYNVCLVAYSGTACIDTFCQSVVVSGIANTNCHAAFKDTFINGGFYFINQSTASTTTFSSYWTFGDGTSALTYSAFHTYPNYGTYNVCLHIKDSSSAGICFDSVCHTVSTFAPTPCHATFHDSIVAGATYNYLHFINTSTTSSGSISSVWSFGDGTTSTLFDPWHNYPTAGTYTVCLTVSDTLVNPPCTSTTCTTVVIPQTTFTCQAYFYDSISTANSHYVHFISYSTAPTNATIHYNWSFGDGSTSTLYDPWHSYTNAGTYTVCLTIVDSLNGQSCTSTYCKVVTITTTSVTPCHAAFHDTLVNNGVYFINQSTYGTSAGIHTNYWTFGDGTSTTTTTANPFHTYTTAGTYNVCLYIKDSSSAGVCIDSVCHTLVVPPTTFTCQAYFYDSISTANSHYVHFMSYSTVPTNAIIHYNWSFGDGSTSTLYDPWHSYTNAGTYTVCLTILDSLNGQSCTSTYCKVVTITTTSVTPCHAAFHDTLVNNGVYFINQSTFSNSSSIHTNYWTFGDGTSTTTTTANPFHTYTTAGTYNVCLYIKDSSSAGICFDSVCHTIVVPPTTFTCQAYFYDSISTANSHYVHFISYSTAPTNAIIHYNWSFGDGSTSTLYDPWHSYTNAGTYTVCLTIVDSLNGQSCTSTYCKVVTITTTSVTPCHAAFHDTLVNNGVYFINQSTYGTSAGIHTNYWTFGDGTSTTTTTANPFHTYTTAGTYNVCLYIKDSSSAGICFDSVCHTIVVPPTTFTCQAYFNDSISTANSHYVHFISYSTAPTNATIHYNWSFGDGSTSTLYDPWHSYTNAGTYTVCLTIVDSLNGQSCTSTYCKVVTITTTSVTPCHAAFHDTLVNNGVYFINQSTYGTIAGLHTNYWTFGDGTSTTTTTANPFHTYTTAGTYNVCLYIKDSSSVGICFDSVCHTIVVPPTTFTCQAYFYDSISTANSHYVHFISYSTAPTNATIHYNWSFGDGSTSTLYDPWHSYANAGTYTVCLTILDSLNGQSCTSTYCKVVTITTTSVTPCHAVYIDSVANLSVMFYNNSTVASGATFTSAWYFGDGFTSTQTNPTHTYTTAGTYQVCLVIISNTGCVDSFCNNVVVTTPQTICNASFTSVVNNCTATFTNTSTGAYTIGYWKLGNGTTKPLVGNNTVTASYSGVGTYYVCLIIADTLGNCIDTTCMPIVIYNCTSNAIKEVALSSQISIAPNPTTDFIQITNTSNQKINMVIVNALGMTVAQQNNISTQQKIDISNLANGVYSIIFKNEKGERVVEKLLKQ